MFNGLKVRPLSEELMEEGLNPDKVLGEIDRNIRLMEGGPSPVSVSGLPAGTKTPRSLGEVGKSMIESAPQPKLDDGEGLDEGVKAKRMKSKAQRAKARRGPKYKRQLRKAKMYKRRHRAQLRRQRIKAIRKAGGSKKYREKQQRAAASNKRLSIVTGLDTLSNLAEELEQAEGRVNFVSPYTEAVLDAGWLCHLLGEIFECYGDERAAEALYRVGDYAAKLSESFEGLTEDQDLTEDQEAEVKRILEAAQKALAAWENLGCPTLPDALDYAVKTEGKHSDDEGDDEEEDEEEDDDDSEDDSEDEED